MQMIVLLWQLLEKTWKKLGRANLLIESECWEDIADGLCRTVSELRTWPCGVYSKVDPQECSIDLQEVSGGGKTTIGDGRMLGGEWSKYDIVDSFCYLGM